MTDTETKQENMYYAVLWTHGTSLFKTDEQIRDAPYGQGVGRVLMAFREERVRNETVASLRPTHARPSGRYVEPLTYERTTRLFLLQDIVRACGSPILASP